MLQIKLFGDLHNSNGSCKITRNKNLYVNALVNWTEEGGFTVSIAKACIFQSHRVLKTSLGSKFFTFGELYYLFRRH